MDFSKSEKSIRVNVRFSNFEFQQVREQNRKEREESAKKRREQEEWLESRIPVHEALKNAIEIEKKKQEDIKKENKLNLSFMKETVKKEREKCVALNTEKNVIERDFISICEKYDDLKSSIPWGIGEGFDASRLEKKINDFIRHKEYRFFIQKESLEGQKLLKTLEFRNRIAESFVPEDQNFDKKVFILSAADEFLSIADNEYATPDRESGDMALSLSHSLLELVLDLTPGVSLAKDLYEAITGKNFITHNSLDLWERSMAILGVVTFGAGSSVTKANKAINIFKKLGNTDNIFGSRGFKKSVEEAQKLLNGFSHIENTANVLRNTPGISIISKPLKDTAILLRGSHGNAGLVPELIGKRLEGKEFPEFKYYKKAFWKNIADSKYAVEFNDHNIALMKEGKAPFVIHNQSLPGRLRYELHHITPISQGGHVYDSSNIMITTPRFHEEVLIREYHKGGR